MQAVDVAEQHVVSRLASEEAEMKARILSVSVLFTC
jgi:hypothetical protein